MIKSMTGFGRAERTVNGRSITVEIRSVNHRYYEYSARIPRAYGYIEDRLKSVVASGVSRGKVEAAVTITAAEGFQPAVAVDMETARGYISALRLANEELGLTDDITLSRLMKLPDIFTVEKPEENEELITSDVCDTARDALEAFIAMRSAEGESMYADINGRLETISGMVGEIERLSPISAENYRSRLYARLCEVLADTNADEQRVITEAAIFADKTAVAEETVRLRSHICQLGELIKQDGPVGRKLDFLIQEFNREANTIGSKAQDIAVTKLVVDLKSEIEKIREQIQNIE